MAYEWTEAMSTGVEELDNEHKTLIAWVNRLSEATATGQAESELMRVISFLGMYAKRHFAHEEGCFLSHRCPQAAANRKAHEEFVAQFTRIKADCEARGVTEAKALELQRFLGDWLVNHILKIDTTLKPYAQ